MSVTRRASGVISGYALGMEPTFSELWRSAFVRCIRSSVCALEHRSALGLASGCVYYLYGGYPAHEHRFHSPGSMHGQSTQQQLRGHVSRLGKKRSITVLKNGRQSKRRIGSGSGLTGSRVGHIFGRVALAMAIAWMDVTPFLYYLSSS